eukprot:TRINITY_DN47552_c0_g1_i1.p1 TRINITY_DN47552_c0_g1~~TRINITY_DN47552_c0_g1_i1.p1  ORF type:complete len:336 (-),score=37.85 TRINITY_DN47552_c0_g1_i1:94-1101(-)
MAARERSRSPAGERSGERGGYIVLAYKTCEALAERLHSTHPNRFTYYKTKWGKFQDSGMDDIMVGGFQPVNVIKRAHVLFMADFNSNDAILSQMHVLVMLCESFLKTLTIVLPYYPVATMERVTVEGEVATASTVSRMLSGLPLHAGSPVRIMFYDLHTLQNRFYFHGGAIASLHTAIPLLKKVLSESCDQITGIAFPDEGAQKRFGPMFKDFRNTVTCGKKRIGSERKVVIQDGDPSGHHILIIDDMVKSGGTLAECAKALKAAGANSISAYVTHAAFPGEAFKQFCRGGSRHVFEKFYVTNSNPMVSERLLSIPTEETVFSVLDLLPQIVADL